MVGGCYHSPIAGRNFPTDTDGTDHIWKSGGYADSATVMASMEIFNCPVSPCGCLADADANCNGNGNGYSNGYGNCNAYSNCQRQNYPHTAAASHAAASAVRPALDRFFGDSRYSRVPVIVYFS